MDFSTAFFAAIFLPACAPFAMSEDAVLCDLAQANDAILLKAAILGVLKSIKAVIIGGPQSIIMILFNVSQYTGRPYAG